MREWIIVTVILSVQFCWFASTEECHAVQRMVAVMEKQPEMGKESKVRSRFALKRMNEESQQVLLSELEWMGSSGVVENIRPLWIVNAVAFDVVRAKDSSKVIRQLCNVDGLSHVRPDGHVYVDEAELRENVSVVMPQDTAWNVKKINAPCLWEAGFTGQDVVVAVIDAGLDTTHLDLNGRVWFNADEIPGNSIDDDGNGYVDDYIGYDFYNDDPDPADDNGHGTMVSGVIAGDGTSGLHVGVAPGTKLMVLKCLSAFGEGRESDIWEALQYALDEGADVVNASFGWQSWMNPNRDAWRAAFTNAMAAGVIVSASAGANSPLCEAPDCITTPGDVPPPWLHPDQEIRGGVSAVIAVGTTDSADAVASFSSVGPVEWPDYPYVPPDSSGLLKPDVCAPGIVITTTQMGGGHIIVSGNSFSTAAVSGALALLISSRPGSTPAELDRSLELSAVDLDTAGKDTVSGSGRIDVCEAQERLGIGEKERAEGPAPAGLRCSPNPFRSSTSIEVMYQGEMPADSRMSLVIYDVAGRAVRTYDLSGSASGACVLWNGISDLGRPVPNGLYFARATTATSSYVSKLVLVR